MRSMATLWFKMHYRNFYHRGHGVRREERLNYLSAQQTPSPDFIYLELIKMPNINFLSSLPKLILVSVREFKF
jgi:hypothetical protein